MGKVTGFLEFARQEETAEAPDGRMRHWREFVAHLEPAQAVLQGARCMDCGIPFCNSGCPVNNIIPDFNDLVYRQQWREALEVLHSTNNFPEFTGRVCPAPCEAACTLNTIYRAFYQDQTKHGFLHSHSYTGNPLACAAWIIALYRA